MKDDEIQAHAAHAVKEWRTKRGISQADLAKELGIHQTAVAKIENQTRRVDFATMVRISDILGIPWSYLKGEQLSKKEKFEQALSAYQVSALNVIKSLYKSRDALDKHGRTAGDLGEWLEQAETSHYLPEGFTVKGFLQDVIQLEGWLEKVVADKAMLAELTDVTYPVVHLSNLLEHPDLPRIDVSEAGQEE